MPSNRDGLALPFLNNSSSSNQNSVSNNSIGVSNGFIICSSSHQIPAPPTLTTPTLTPTTLRNIEQMFMDSETGVADECRPPDYHENAARFEPPAVNLSEVIIPTVIQDEYVYPNPDSNSNSAIISHVSNDVKVKQEEIEASWSGDIAATEASNFDNGDRDIGALVLPGPHSNEVSSRGLAQPPDLISDHAPLPSSLILSRLQPQVPQTTCLILEQPNFQLQPQQTSSSPSPSVTINNNNTNKSNNNNNNNSKRTRKSNLTPDEEHKKMLRRQRNKEAAARCRKRRMDQTMTLQEQVDMLEKQKSDMKEDIKSLEAQREELEKLLEVHRSDCRKSSEVTSVNAKKSLAKKSSAKS